MKNEAFVLENMNGEVVRHLRWTTENLIAVQRRDTGRVEFVQDVKSLEKDKIPFVVLAKTTKKAVAEKKLKLGTLGYLKAADDEARLAHEIEPSREENEHFPVILKYSAGGYVAVLALMICTSFILQKFFTEDTEPQVVTVVQQQRLPEVQPKARKTVEVSQKKIRRTRTKARVSKRRVKTNRSSRVARSSKSNRGGNGRAGTSLNQRGALGVLGGFSKNSHGSGGLNLKARSNNPGIGYGGMAARGGNARGMLGKGLVTSGVGNGGSLKGYGGYGTKGKGGGRPGYGSMRMAGSSGAYFEPLGEESLVEGGLDRDQINAVIQRNLGQVIYCYEQGLQTKPSLAGRVAVKFVINGRGHVSVANIANTSLRSSKVESCIVKKLKNWRFPQPTGQVNVRVTYPFVLKRLSQG